MKALRNIAAGLLKPRRDAWMKQYFSEWQKTVRALCRDILFLDHSKHSFVLRAEPILKVIVVDEFDEFDKCFQFDKGFLSGL